MKKIIALLLCLFCAVTVLASCEEEIGAYRDQYDYEEEVIDDVAVHIYVPCEAGTSENAISTVSGRIATECAESFTATVTMHYFDSSEYQQKVLAATAANKAAADEMTRKLTEKNRAIVLKEDELTKLDARNETRAQEIKNEIAELKKQPISYSVDLVLINSAEMMNALKESGMLSDLTPFLSQNAYGRLNTKITKALLDASMIDGKYFAIPNNHILTGGYQLLVIDKAIARDELSYSPRELKALRSMDEAVQLMGESNAQRCAKELANMRYEDIARLEEEGNYVNIIATPSVDAEEAFLSAFAVANAVDDTETVGAVSVSADRAMQIIYALNTDEKLHNLFLYGFESANYKVASVENGKTVITRAGINDADLYIIDLLYAGDQYLSYYIADGDFVSASVRVWNAEAEANGIQHNKSTDDPILPPEPITEDPTEEPSGEPSNP